MVLLISISGHAQNTSGPPPLRNFTEIKELPLSDEKINQFISYTRNPQSIFTEEVKSIAESLLAYARQHKKIDHIALLLATKGIFELTAGNQEMAQAYAEQCEDYLSSLDDAKAVALIFDITRIYSRTRNFDKAILYYDKMEEITKSKTQFLVQRIAGLKNKINIQFVTGDKINIVANYKSVLKLAKESNNPALLKNTRFSYAHMLINLKKENEAFEILKELIPDLDNSITNHTPVFFTILSRNYEANGDYRNALKYAEKGFNLPTATNQQKGNDINRMILLSFLLKEHNNYDKYFAEHKKYGMDNNSLYARKQYFLAEARYYHAKEKYKPAIANYKKVLNLKMDEQIAPTLDITSAANLGIVYTKELNKDSATYYFKVAENKLKKYPVSPSVRYIYTNALREFNQQNSVGADSLVKSLQQEMHLKDTLYQMSLSKINHELETKYRVFEKEKALTLAKQQQQVQQLQLKQQKQKNWFILIGATTAIILLSAITYILFQRKKQAKTLHEVTVANLKKQHQLEIMNRLSEAQEQEKKRVAERLHDEVGAMLSIAKLNINTLQENIFKADTDSEKKLAVAQNLMNNISETVRNISHSLMPIALEKYGFKAAVLDLLTSIKTANSLTVEHVIEGLDNTANWPQHFTLSTYRIIQEIINNVIKHAQATHLFVQLVELDNAITIYIEDNGKGLKPTDDNKGAGLKLLETNIAYLSGKLEIKGELNQGTFALIELPIPNASSYEN